MLPDLVCAVASLGGDRARTARQDLDYFTGMGQENVEDIKLMLLRRPSTAPVASWRRTEKRIMAASADEITAGFETLISPADAAAFRDGMDEYLPQVHATGPRPGDEGWWGDSVADVVDWGFDLASIAVPVQFWHGRHDKFVPYQHGEWLARHIPGVDAHLTDTTGT